MIKQLFSPGGLWQSQGLAVLRIITGLLMTYHGLEIFDSKVMDSYLPWDTVKDIPAAHTMLYVGKAFELLAGICLTIGLFTRVAALIIALVMFFICFKIGHGKFWYEDQHPFLFGLLALVFFFAGPAKWSIDHLINRYKRFR